MGPDPQDVKTVGQLGTFSVRQEGVIVSCEGRRAGLVEIIEAHNGKPKERPWWKVW